MTIRFEKPATRVHHWRAYGFVCALVLSMVAFLLSFSAGASADFTFCSFGSGAGQCNRPSGVAVDRSNGQVYVADKDNHRIDVFTSAGHFLFAFGWGVQDGTTNGLQTCTTTCFPGIPGSGAGQQEPGETELAIDNDPASPSYRDLYVAERNNARVQKFTPTGDFILMIGGGVNKVDGTNVCTAAPGSICGAGSAGGKNGQFNHVIRPAVAPGGTLLVADTARAGGQTFEAARVQSFGPTGAFAGQPLLLGEPSQGSALAVDSIGNFYLGLAGSLQKYDPSGSLLEAHPANNLKALGTDTFDNIFTFELDVGARVVTEYDSSGGIVRRFGYGSIEENMESIVPFHSTGGELYGTELAQHRVRYLSFPPPGPIPCCGNATVGNTTATLKGSINPEGRATTYHFDYVDDEGFKAGGFSNAGVKSTPETPIGSDFTLQDVEAQIGCSNPELPPQPTCLFPNTLYHYRLVATNEDGAGKVEGTFLTKPPLELLETYATAVGTDAGQLHATVNPLAIPATGYFEYVDDAAYQSDIAQGEGHDGFAEATKAPNVDASQAPIGFGAGAVPKGGSAELFSLKPGTTYHYRFVASDPFVTVAGPEHSLTTFPIPLPPANGCVNQAFRVGPSANLPDCRAYEMVSPVDKNGGDIKVLGSTLNFAARLEQSAADGNRFAYSSVTAFGDAVSAPWTSEYIATREDGEGWSTHAISPPRESHSLTQTPAFKFDVQFKTFSDDLSSAWMIHDTEPPLDECAPEGVINLYRRDNQTESYEALTVAKPTDTGQTYELELQGISADEAHAVFGANGKLTGNASTSGQTQVYEHISDPEGGCGELRLVSALPNGKASSGVSNLGTYQGIPGESRENNIVNAVSADGSHVFWSVRGAALYLRDMDAGKTVQVTAAAGAHFWTAKPDGSKAIYTAGESLYEFDSANALKGEPASTLIAGGVPGVVAYSEDLSRLYFVSSQELEGEGVAGKPNLYLREAGGTSFIAALYSGDSTLPGGDLNGFPKFGFALARPEPIKNGVRVTQDGSHLAFVSAESLTGYDNKDASDGRPALEVYLYDVETENLACISCNPTGARPAARQIADTASLFTRRVSAHMAPAVSQFFAPRALSTDGSRLFFESFEALLARDTNGRDDVYEWQRAGSQTECDEVGAELYVPSAGGCLSLISTGQNAGDSEFADASPNGSDVFIRTSSSLLPQDPGQVDLYDARVNGGLPQPPGPPAACEGEACQGPLAPPSDPTPASSAFEGAGNVNEKSPSCRKPKVRRKGRCVPKTGRKHAKRHRRAAR